MSIDPGEVWAPLAALDLAQPQLLVVPSPLHGGPPLARLRAALAARGTVRFRAASRTELEVAFAPGEPEAPLIALTTIVRSDAAGIERAILSALPHVDEVVIGLDRRGDAETRAVVEALADTVYDFGPEDIGLSEADWAADKIHFANARNIGRERTRAPWTMVIDADEYMICETADIRAFARMADPEIAAFNVTLSNGSLQHLDPQRLTRTRFRYYGASHNQLPMSGHYTDSEIFVVCDGSLRTKDERIRRNAQRNEGIASLIERVEGGDLVAMFHVAKHKLGQFDPTAVATVEDFRLRTEIHGDLSAERIWLAIACAAYFQQAGDLARAEQWACRALLDEPRVEAMCILGDVAEAAGSLQRAVQWYECACVLPPSIDKFCMTDFMDDRFRRLEELREAAAASTAQAAAG